MSPTRASAVDVGKIEHAKVEGGIRTHGLSKRSSPGKPLVTVVTVVFNCAGTLEGALRSVIGQTYPHVEHIIIDGGSTDGTLDVLRRYDQHIDYWLSEKDNGIYDAMNKGIALAHGEYIGMLNADDYFADPGVLAMIAGRLQAGDVDAVFSCLDIIDTSNPDLVLRKYRISRYSKFMLRIGVMPPHPTFYCRKSCYEQAGPYRINYRIAADFEMLVRLLLRHKITWAFLNHTTVKMRAGGVSSRGFRNRLVLNREILRACRENGLYTNFLILMLKIPVRMLELVV